MSDDREPGTGATTRAATDASERAAVRQVLQQRARLLARPPAPAAAPDALEALTFGVGRESCAVESRFVHAVFRLGELTPLPGAPAPIVGVTGWRGDVLTLLDVRALLGADAGGTETLGRVIVLGEARPTFGVLVEELRDVVRLDRSELRTDPEATSGRGLVRAVTRAGVVLLDAERLLSIQSETRTT